jgi:3-keto-disaccharide hydrolase
MLSRLMQRQEAWSAPVILLLLLLVATSDPKQVPLFDGKSFQGWEGDTLKSFRIESGAIVGGTLQGKIPHNEFLCTQKSYTNFELRLQFKVVGANAGVQFRSRRIPNHYEVMGYQADLGDPEWWGCLYDESRRNKVLAKSNMAEVEKILKHHDWNEYRIRCEGRHIQLWINGYQTVDYFESDQTLEQNGIIGLQIHGGQPSEAWYRDIAIEELP